MANDQDAEPLRGGAELECLLAYESLTVSDIENISSAGLLSPLQLRTKNAFGLADENYDNFLDVPAFKSVETYLAWLHHQDNGANAHMNFIGVLHDLKVFVSISVHFLDRVISITTPENMLWEFSKKKELAKFERLDAFFDLCEHICLRLPPKNALISTEAILVEDISLSNPTSEKTYPFIHEEFFSEKEKRELFDWYVNVY